MQADQKGFPQAAIAGTGELFSSVHFELIPDELPSGDTSLMIFDPSNPVCIIPVVALSCVLMNNSTPVPSSADYNSLAMRSPCRPAVSRTFLNFPPSGAMFQIQGPNVANVVLGMNRNMRAWASLASRRGAIAYSASPIVFSTCPERAYQRNKVGDELSPSRDGAIPGRVKSGPPKSCVKS